MAQFSVNPAGEQFPIPERADYAAEFQRVSGLAAKARAEGKEIVVVGVASEGVSQRAPRRASDMEVDRRD